MEPLPGEVGGSGGGTRVRGCAGGGTPRGQGQAALRGGSELQSLCSEPYLTCKSPGPRPAASDPRSGAWGLGVCTLRCSGRGLGPTPWGAWRRR